MLELVLKLKHAIRERKFKRACREADELHRQGLLMAGFRMDKAIYKSGLNNKSYGTPHHRPLPTGEWRIGLIGRKK